MFSNGTNSLSYTLLYLEECKKFKIDPLLCPYLAKKKMYTSRLPSTCFVVLKSSILSSCSKWVQLKPSTGVPSIGQALCKMVLSNLCGSWKNSVSFNQLKMTNTAWHRMSMYLDGDRRQLEPKPCLSREGHLFCEASAFRGPWFRASASQKNIEYQYKVGSLWNTIWCVLFHSILFVFVYSFILNIIEALPSAYWICSGG